MQQSARGEVDLGFGLGELRLRLRGPVLGEGLDGALRRFGFVFAGPVWAVALAMPRGAWASPSRDRRGYFPGGEFIRLHVGVC